jgi:hypothetical protein
VDLKALMAKNLTTKMTAIKKERAKSANPNGARRKNAPL